MLIHNLYVLRDVKVGAFNKPIALENQAVLERALKLSCNDPEHPFHNNPEDYQVYFVGTYDSTTGEIDAAPPEFLFNVSEFKETEK